MTEKNSSHSQKKQAEPATSGPTAAAADPTARVDAMLEEMGRVQERGVAQLHTLVDEYAKLAHASLTYSTEMMVNWQKLALQSARQTANTVKPLFAELRNPFQPAA